MKCRFDGLPLTHEFIDLGQSPPSNSFLTKDQLNEPEVYYPLKLWVSERTFLVQVDEYKKADEIFSEDYVYFSSFSTSWLNHAKRYVDMAVERFALDQQSHVIEIASNDGYLLQYFKEREVSCLGIEPSASVAKAAQEKGIETTTDFFGVRLARELEAADRKADLLIGNNVFAHVPDLNDFVAGLKIVLKKGGVITLEFPHLMQLIDNNQFDTIYHEHFSYFSFYTASLIFEKHGLVIFDVEEIPTHGGSLRIFARHAENEGKAVTPRVACLLLKEENAGMKTLAYYQGFDRKVNKIRDDLLAFLKYQESNGRRVASYGAAAKGNTLLNYCGIGTDLIEFVADASPHKQGRFLPGSHIPVVEESRLKEEKPDFVLILPWNIKEEIIEQLGYIRKWGGKFVVPLPFFKVIE
jgi:SAM-dependent methyltransferase